MDWATEYHLFIDLTYFEYIPTVSACAEICKPMTRDSNTSQWLVRALGTTIKHRLYLLSPHSSLVNSSWPPKPRR
jgi:hypothetical protein